MAWEVGDVVRLKSGGPRMAVTAATPNNIVCAWFIAADVKTKGFPNEAVEATNGLTQAELDNPEEN